MQTAGNNSFNNHSGPTGGINRGNYGKFTEAQTEERLKVHAKALAIGNLGHAEIVALWKERFGISITVQSEKEWRKSHRDRIEKKKQEMIETGEIAVPVVSEKVLADSLMTAAIQLAGSMQMIKRKMQHVLRGVNVECDYMALAGVSAEDYDEADKETRVKYDRQIGRLRDRNSERLKIFQVLNSSFLSSADKFSKQMDTMSAMTGRIKIRDKEIQQLVDERFEDNKRREEEQADEDAEFDVLDGEVSDEDRGILTNE